VGSHVLHEVGDPGTRLRLGLTEAVCQAGSRAFIISMNPSMRVLIAPYPLEVAVGREALPVLAQLHEHALNSRDRLTVSMNFFSSNLLPVCRSRNAIRSHSWAST
jgi:hypothetical protein